MDEETKLQESSQTEEREDHGVDEYVSDANKVPFSGKDGKGCGWVLALGLAAALLGIAALAYAVWFLLTKVL